MEQDVKKQPSQDGGFPPHVCASAVEAEHEQQEKDQPDQQKAQTVAKGRKAHVE